MEYVFYFLNIVGLVRIILIQPLNFLLEFTQSCLKRIIEQQVDCGGDLFSIFNKHK